ncbi:MAG TPA: type II toxin-antitoxin system PemK/MazF family toxin [Thermoanaerobaculia bacterium]|nr:type II toxin-antitoxin system PemK/MazF family toxin [Thermoanaerobaculia bacterium]
MKQARRGEIWSVELNPVTGHEQGGKRPGLVISDDLFNAGPAGLVVMIPLTTKDKNIPFHVALEPPDGGLIRKSFIKCEDIRSVSVDRLQRRHGEVSPDVMHEVEDRVRILLSL